MIDHEVVAVSGGSGGMGKRSTRTPSSEEHITIMDSTAVAPYYWSTHCMSSITVPYSTVMHDYSQLQTHYKYLVLVPVQWYSK